MGSAQSTQKKPTSLVLLPSTPTEFSPGLVSKLQSSIESDYTRSQYTEKYIEDQVNARLQELAKSSSSTLKDLLEKSEPEEDNNTLSSSGLQAQLQQLKESLESRPERHVLNDDLKKSRSDIVACLKEFSNKPMKCVEQVEAFKAEVQKYEKSIL